MKKHYNLFTIIFFTLVHSLPLKGQFVASSPARAQTVKDNILAVVVETVDEKELKKLKESDIVAYKEGVESFNQYLREGIDNKKAFSDKVTFINREEADSLRQEKDAAYCILEIGEVNNYRMWDFYSTNSLRWCELGARTDSRNYNNTGTVNNSIKDYK